MAVFKKGAKLFKSKFALDFTLKQAPLNRLPDRDLFCVSSALNLLPNQGRPHLQNQSQQRKRNLICMHLGVYPLLKYE